VIEKGVRRRRSPRSDVEAPSLHAIALQYGTDKAAPRRSLAAIYETFLVARRDQAVSLLEIGVLGGSSLRMWRDYFPNGKIYGLDRDEAAREHAEQRIAIFIGDQEDASILDHIIRESGGLDVVVDDGGHRARQQIGSLLYLWPHLKPGGLYIVEDIHTSYLAEYGMAWRKPGTAVEFLKGVVDDVHAMWHDSYVLLQNVRSIHFYQETCVIQKAEDDVA
jgi:precorrin-6B methylase 2